jgi:hypothetical protein
MTDVCSRNEVGSRDVHGVDARRSPTGDQDAKPFFDAFLAFFSLRFSLSDLPDFFVLCCLGDLSAMVSPPVEDTIVGDFVVRLDTHWGRHHSLGAMTRSLASGPHEPLS